MNDNTKERDMDCIALTFAAVGADFSYRAALERLRIAIEGTEAGA